MEYNNKTSGEGARIIRNDQGMRVAGASRAWLIVQPITGKENVLTEVLRGQGFESYRPMVLKSGRDRRVPGLVLKPHPMFPGYLMVRPTTGQAFRIFSMPYVWQVLPMALLDVVVAEIRDRERDHVIKFLEKPKPLRRGEKVKTVGGLVDGFVSETLDANRVALLTGLFGGSARFVCSADQVIQH